MIWVGQPVMVATFAAAVSAHLGPLMAEAVGEAAEGLYGADCQREAVSLEDAGKLLATALIPLVRQDRSIPDLALRWAQIATGADRVTIAAPQALQHPLLHDWGAETLERWLSAQILSGALLCDTLPNMPDDYLEVRDEGGQVGAQVALRFPGGLVVAYLSFGEDPIPHALSCKVGVSGARLRAMGVELRNLAFAAPAVAQTADDESEPDSLANPSGAADAARHIVH